jgi:hypothetical protein
MKAERRKSNLKTDDNSVSCHSVSAESTENHSYPEEFTLGRDDNFVTGRSGSSSILELSYF